MALLEATNTLLDFENVVHSAFLSASLPSPPLSSDNSIAAMWECPSEEDSPLHTLASAGNFINNLTPTTNSRTFSPPTDTGTLTSLTNVSMTTSFTDHVVTMTPSVSLDFSDVSSQSFSSTVRSREDTPSSSESSDCEGDMVDYLTGDTLTRLVANDSYNDAPDAMLSTWTQQNTTNSTMDDMRQSKESHVTSSTNACQKTPQNPGTRRRPRPTNLNNRLPPCRICGDSASGFHYGVNSCEACKRFFRRALKRKRHFKCRGQKNCVIKGQKNNLCGYCRYERCLALGMSKTNIKTGRYTHEKRAQDILEVQSLGTDTRLMDIPESEVKDIVRRLVTVHAKVITNADVPEEEMLRRAMQVMEAEKLKQEVFGFSDTLTPEQYNEVFQVTGLDIDERKKHMEFVAKSLDIFVHGYVRFGKGVPGFSTLPLNDQANLLKLARCEVWFLGAYKGFFTKLHIFYAPNRDCRHKSALERLLGKDYSETAFRLAAKAQALDLTMEEVIVLKAVCLTFPDRGPMEDARRVEEVQWRMLRCLHHLLTKNHRDDPCLFHKVMDLAVALRNLTELSQKALSSTHFADAIRRNATLVDMILI